MSLNESSHQGGKKPRSVLCCRTPAGSALPCLHLLKAAATRATTDRQLRCLPALPHLEKCLVESTRRSRFDCCCSTHAWSVLLCISVLPEEAHMSEIFSIRPGWLLGFLNRRERTPRLRRFFCAGLTISSPIECSTQDAVSGS